jgi:hypothetical protein
MNGIFDGLTFAELAVLSAKFRRARQECRRVMHVNWWNAPVTETYRRMVVDFQEDDPLFDENTRHAEMRR